MLFHQSWADESRIDLIYLDDGYCFWTGTKGGKWMAETDQFEEMALAGIISFLSCSRALAAVDWVIGCALSKSNTDSRPRPIQREKQSNLAVQVEPTNNWFLIELAIRGRQASSGLSLDHPSTLVPERERAKQRLWLLVEMLEQQTWASALMMRINASKLAN